MAVLVLLRNEIGAYALYKDGDMVANFSRRDYRQYVDSQIERWKDSPDDDVIERKHAGPWKGKLENKGVKNERLKSLGNKKPSQVKEEAAPEPKPEPEPKPKPEPNREPTPRELALAQLKGE